MLLPYLGTFVFKYFAKGNKEWLNKALAFISMLGIGIIITIITAAGRESLLEVGLLLILACFMQNMFGYGLGYSVARFILRMSEKDCRTIALKLECKTADWHRDWPCKWEKWQRLAWHRLFLAQ